VFYPPAAFWAGRILTRFPGAPVSDPAGNRWDTHRIGDRRPVSACVVGARFQAAPFYGKLVTTRLTLAG